METENELPKNEEKKEEASVVTPVVMKKFFSPKVQMSKKNIGIALGILFVIGVLGNLFFLKGFFVAATVNGSPITRWSIVGDLEKRAGKATLDAFITKKLITDAAKARGIVVSSSDVDMEVQKIEASVTAQGTTLDAALLGQGMTRQDFAEQILIRKQIEQILADRLVVSDEELEQYASTSRTPGLKGAALDEWNNQAREQLKEQKFNKEAGEWMKDLRANAKIQYYVEY